MKALNRRTLQMELLGNLAPRVISACKAPQHLSHVTLAHTERLWELQLLLIAQPVPQMSNVIKEAFINIQLKLSSVLLEITVLMPLLLRSVTEVTIVLPMSKHRSSVPMASSNTMNSSQSALSAQKDSTALRESVVLTHPSLLSPALLVNTVTSEPKILPTVAKSSTSHSWEEHPRVTAFPALLDSSARKPMRLELRLNSAPKATTAQLVESRLTALRVHTALLSQRHLSLVMLAFTLMIQKCTCQILAQLALSTSIVVREA